MWYRSIPTEPAAKRNDALAGDSQRAERTLAPASADQALSSSSSSFGFARSIARLLSIPLLLALLLAGFTAAVDPYWLFGAPSVPNVNESRPLYETNVVQAKPYQLLRLRPKTVALGSSRTEVGLSPEHPGWADRHAFNFALPAANSYEIMLSFLHAQSVAAPLRQAVVGLDFLSFNIYRKLGPTFDDRRFAGDGLASFAAYLDTVLPERKKTPERPGADRLPEGEAASAPTDETGDWNEKLYLALYPDVAGAVSDGVFPSGYVHYVRWGKAEGRLFARVPRDWSEKLYLTLYPDVALAVSEGKFLSGYVHYVQAGRLEGRLSARIPSEWNEAGYLQAHPDVAQSKLFISGYHHYLAAGRKEGRLGGFPLPGWNEAGYLAANSAARVAIARGQYRNGFIHYAAVGRSQGRVGGLPPANLLEWLELKWPPLYFWLFRVKELWGLAFSATALEDAIKTVRQQAVPASFSERGQRIWRGQDEVLRNEGGTGTVYRGWLTGPIVWGVFWFDPPERMYCLSHPDTLMSGLDPYRFMLRQAHAEGTELHLFVSPLHTAIRAVIDVVGLGERFEFWLRELVRINDEEAARAGRQPFALWDFSDTNSITVESVPADGDLKPMRWFWETSHYREITGNLVLDRVFGTRDPSRPLPEDFGARLTAASIETLLDRSRTKRAQWVAANPDLMALIHKTAQQRPDRQREATCW
jgi:hypothetical protein